MAFLVHYFDFAVNQQRAVIHNCNFYVWHSILRSRLARFWPRDARLGRMVVGPFTTSGQYFGTEGSTSSDHARIPPFRLRILRKPARCRNSTASAERFPLRQWATISRELSSSFTRFERSPSGIRWPPRLQI